MFRDGTVRAQLTSRSARPNLGRIGRGRELVRSRDVSPRDLDDEVGHLVEIRIVLLRDDDEARITGLHLNRRALENTKDRTAALGRETTKQCRATDPNPGRTESGETTLLSK